MGKFKVGDKVLIKKCKVPEGMYDPDWVLGMDMFNETIQEIDEIGSNGTYYIKGDGCGWSFAEAWLSPVKGESVVVYRSKDNPAVVVAKNTITKETAKATCAPEDEFDFFVGAQIAIARLLGKPKEEIEAIWKKEEKTDDTIRVGDTVHIVAGFYSHRYRCYQWLDDAGVKPSEAAMIANSDAQPFKYIEYKVLYVHPYKDGVTLAYIKRTDEPICYLYDVDALEKVK